MPTGLTGPLTERDMTLQEFAWRCASQFGALISMRDAHDGAEIPPEVKPSSYHQYELNRVRAEIARLEALTDEQALAEAEAERESILKEWREGKAENDAQCARFRVLLAEVEAWEPPTPDHAGLKNLMLDQLKMDMEPSTYLQKKPKLPGLASWRGEKLMRRRESIAYHEEALARDIERAKEATAWVQALWKQLGPPPQNEERP